MRNPLCNHKRLLAVSVVMFTGLSRVFGTGFGVTNYEMGTQGLSNMTALIAADASVVVGICYVIGAILSIYSAMTIYIKMNSGEEGVIKSIYTLVGACLFLLTISIVFPSFFGFNLYHS